MLAHNFDLIDLSAHHHQVKANLPVSDSDKIAHEMTVSSKTSIKRKSASAPLKLLIKKGLIKSESNTKALNYGKGKYSGNDDHDTNTLRELYGNCHAYDYTFAYDKTLLLKGFYNVIYCAYVVNVLPPLARIEIYKETAACLAKGVGNSAFFAARSEKDRGLMTMKAKAECDGLRTRTGSFQKGYREENDELLQEAREHFLYVRYIQKSGAYHLIQASHDPFID
ncbi:hypothetical protein [Photobacterium leiognathi]|uniref:hypothetical protein n=1 Tax=Photobacterium leiognathi TaxID=553611 RepID=UPI0029811A0F|nr:hypothetical protein [Photobacterium leiognathi]